MGDEWIVVIDNALHDIDLSIYSFTNYDEALDFYKARKDAVYIAKVIDV